MAKLGAKVEMFGCVGDDANGTRLLENFKKVGVETGHIKVLEGVPTGSAMITVGENDNTIIVVPGANGKVDRDYIDRIKEELKTFDMVVLQQEIPLDTVYYVVDFCYDNQIPVVLNPAPASNVPLEVIEKVTYVTPNEHEAVLIFGEEYSTEDLLREYPEKLIITQGSRGVITCLKNGEILSVPARKANVADTTGAGDAFVAGLLAGLADSGIPTNTRQLERIIAQAQICGALATTAKGAMTALPRQHDLPSQ